MARSPSESAAMSIDARISSVRERDGRIEVRLAPIQASDGQMSIAGRKKLIIRQWRRKPVAGQQIWGNAAGCIVEAGNGVRWLTTSFVIAHYLEARPAFAAMILRSLTALSSVMASGVPTRASGQRYPYKGIYSLLVNRWKRSK